MHICFLSILPFEVTTKNIYTDLIQCFCIHDHTITVICPTQRRDGQITHVESAGKIRILRVRTFNLTGQCGLLEKGLAMVFLEHQFLHAIKNNLSLERFDCILYSTPPVTLGRVINYLKNKNNALTYLLLKDIMPQGAVDLKLFSKYSLPWLYFRYKEKQLYNISEYIGCMSPANCEYILKHNRSLSTSKIEVNPNSLSPICINKNTYLLNKYNIPKDKIIFIYGGNLGRPQGIEFLLRCIKVNEKRHNAHFVIAGSGTERKRVENFFTTYQPKNSTLLPYLPKEQYESLCSTCNVGLVFLDKSFTFPNFPSRILSYMQAEMPYIAAVDTVTDVGTIAEKNHFGINCLWGDIKKFNECVDKFLDNPSLIQEMGRNARQYFLENYTVEKSYQTIMHHFQ